jgi:hypothetical protein
MNLGSVAFPTHVNENTLLTLADNLMGFVDVLGDGQRRFSTSARFADREWVGASGEAFAAHIRHRSAKLGNISQAVPPAAQALRHYVSAIRAATANYKNFAALERSVNSSSSGLARSRRDMEIWETAISGQKAAAEQAKAAAEACAAIIEHVVAEVTKQLSDSYRLSRFIKDAKEPIEDIGNAIGGAEGALGRASEEYTRGRGTDKEVTRMRWKPGYRQLPAFGGGQHTFEEFIAKMRLLRQLSKAGKVVELAGPVIDAYAQQLEDLELNFTPEQRARRAAAAGVIEGGGSAVGARVGGVGGASAGSVIPGYGTAIGAIGGSIAGGKAGSAIGKWAKELLFKWSPGGVVGDKREK